MRALSGAALITGAARRLGRALALYLASRGYDIVLHCHHSRAEAEALLPCIASFARQGWVLQADLSDSHQAIPLLEAAHKVCPHLNILINNASIYYPLHFSETSPTQFDQFYQLHVKSPFFLIQAFARLCGEGLVVNLTDAQAPRPDYFAYSLSKQGLTHLTLLAAQALGPRIRVNAIAPGHILPPITGNPESSIPRREAIPLQRKGQIEDVTAALQVLLDNPYMTGQILYVDGGLHLI